MEDRHESIERLEILINAMILNYLTENEFNSDEDRSYAYENLLYKTLVEGVFDDIFLSKYLDDLDKSKRQELMNLSRKYSDLCFYHGKFEYWSYSVEGVINGDKMVAELLLSNFNYLIRLAKNGGEDVLKFLNKFKNSDLFSDGSVIAILVNRFFGNLDILETILIDMAKEDGKYKDFTDTQKIIMCESPLGVLINRKDDGSLEFINIDDLKKKISNKFIGEDDYSINNISSDDFIRIIEDIKG